MCVYIVPSRHRPSPWSHGSLLSLIPFFISPSIVRALSEPSLVRPTYFSNFKIFIYTYSLNITLTKYNTFAVN